MTTVQSDYNGFYDVLMPSTNQINCPTPSGVCAGMYRFVGNDPGVPGHLNPDYNPRYRVIGTEFEAMPGHDHADRPRPDAGGRGHRPARHRTDRRGHLPARDEHPAAVRGEQALRERQRQLRDRRHRLRRHHRLGHASTAPPCPPPRGQTSTWTSRFRPARPRARTSCEITAANGQHTVNALTFHVLGGGYTPTVREVGPGSPVRHHPGGAGRGVLEQRRRSRGRLPGQRRRTANPRGAYYENLIMASPVKLQGVGPGGFQGQDYVAGTVLDAGGFGGDSQLATDWWTKIAGYTWDGNQNVNDGEGIYVLASQNATTAAGRARQFTSTLQGQHRRLRHPRRRPAGLPGQHQRPDRDCRPDCRRTSPPRVARSSPTPTHATCRSPTTWSRTTAAPTAPSGSARRTCPPRTPTSTTRTSGSRTTGSSPTPAPTSPEASGCSPAPTPTRSPTTTSAATSRWSTAAA